MDINIDSAIFIGFLVATIVVGLYSSRGSNTMRQYAVGDRNFSTATIVATIVATWISGEFFYSNIYETYDKGLYAMWIALGDPLYLLIIGLFFAPRMAEFLGNLSIAEAMGDLYGQKVRIITAIASFVGTAGLIAIQLKLAGSIFEYALGIPSVYGTIIATVIVTLYSSLGGIKSVTFTDVIQFFTFGAVIPLSAYAILTSIDDFDVVTKMLTTHHLFDYKEVFNFSNELSFKQLFLFLLFMIPGFNPAIFQRIAIAKDTTQVARSFTIAAITCLFFLIIVNWVSVLTLSINPSLEPDEIVKFVILNSSFTGLKGAMLAGVMAMIMSTVDSFINSTAVIVVHDFFKPLNFNRLASNEITSARVVSGIIGISSLGLSLYEGSLQELLVITLSFYMPVVTVPFIMATLGFRSSGKAVILGMLAGFIAVTLWDYVWVIKSVNSAFIGMLAHLIVLTGSHYLLKQPGGWVGIKDPAPLIAVRSQRRQRFQKLISDIKSFNLLNTFQKNCPQGDGLISILGFFVMISAFSSTHTLPKEYQTQYSYILAALYPLTLCSSSALISYPLWLQSWKETRLLGVCWNIIMFFVLISFSFLMVLISKFSEIQLTAFLVNIILVSSLITWRWALFTITIGVSITTFCYYNYLHVEIEENLITSQFKIVYVLLLISSTVIAFLKPKQEHQELTEEKNNHLEVMIKDREEELGKAQELKHEFLRNLEHEVNTPLVGLTSLAPMVLEDFDRLSPQQMKKYVKNIVDSHERYKTLSDSLLDLSKLDSMKYKLDKVKLDLSDLIKDRLDYCCRLYLGNKGLEFATEIDSDVIIECDERYITSLIDNLIINAIKYSKEGKITLKLSKKDASVVEFQIIDEGIGIPKPELHDIFGAFVVSSKTRTPSGGRGIGLALCKKIVEVHGGSIRADSDGERGAAFIVELPMSGTSESKEATVQEQDILPPAR